MSNRWYLSLLPWLLAAGTAGFVLYFSSQVFPWTDEFHTHWFVRNGVRSLLTRLQTDVHPPLYFLLTALVLPDPSASPVLLRAVSTVAAVLTVPALVWTARALLPRGQALGLGLLAAFHPLIIYYGYEARSYALLTLLLTLSLGLMLRLPQAKGPRLWWLLGVVMMLAMLTHHLAVFVSMAYVIAAFLGSARDGKRWQFTLQVACVLGLAALPSLPWLLSSLGSEGGILWVKKLYWKGAVKWAGPALSVAQFGFGADHPNNMRHYGLVKGFPLAGGIGTACILLAAGWAFLRRRKEPDHYGRVVLGCGVGVLLLLWTYSWLGKPAYLPARYDLIALPATLLTFAYGMAEIARQSRRPWVYGLLLFCGLAAHLSALRELVQALPVKPSQYDRAALHVRDMGGEDDVVVSFGFSYLTMMYFRDQFRPQWTVIAYPRGLEKTPGAYAPEIYRRDPAELERQAQATFETLATRYTEGRKIWIINDGAGRDINQRVFSRLTHRVKVDTRASRFDLGVVCIRQGGDMAFNFK